MTELGWLLEQNTMEDLSFGLFAIAFSFAIVGISAFVGYVFVGRILEARRSQHWSPVPARILSSELEVKEEEGPNDSRNTFYYPQLRFAYDVAGQSYESNRVRVGDQKRLTEKSARQVLDAYPAGSTATAYVDPTNPSRVLLDRSVPSVTWLGIVLGVLLCGVGLWLSSWSVSEFFL